MSTYTSIDTKPIAGKAALKLPGQTSYAPRAPNTKPIAGKAALKPTLIKLESLKETILNPLQAKQH